ncbi:hypothetical protein ANN_13086 [Periplaneta americana]|uniref:Uncharacterized protein n=1 Tax=Periplaneta americana TaxID=6978 RepID=A0ABQ8TKM8_PERAM|nr:hypothetical protein ANN_13086 [Periplaneta americana]
MSDEAHSELPGSVNKHNMRYWSAQNPRELHMKPLHRQKVTVWCAISTFDIIGPYFFEDAVIVISGQYISMLIESFFSLLRRRNIDVTRIRYQHDGLEIRLRLYEPCLDTALVISLTQLVDPDLTVCDFLWA